MTFCPELSQSGRAPCEYYTKPNSAYRMCRRTPTLWYVVPALSDGCNKQSVLRRGQTTTLYWHQLDEGHLKAYQFLGTWDILRHGVSKRGPGVIENDLCSNRLSRQSEATARACAVSFPTDSHPAAFINDPIALPTDQNSSEPYLNLDSRPSYRQAGSWKDGPRGFDRLGNALDLDNAGLGMLDTYTPDRVIVAVVPVAEGNTTGRSRQAHDQEGALSGTSAAPSFARRLRLQNFRTQRRSVNSESSHIPAMYLELGRVAAASLANPR